MRTLERVNMETINVGDTVTFAKTTTSDFSTWNDCFSIGKEYKITDLDKGDHTIQVVSDKHYTLYMPSGCYRVAVEEKIPATTRLVPVDMKTLKVGHVVEFTEFATNDHSSWNSYFTLGDSCTVVDIDPTGKYIQVITNGYIKYNLYMPKTCFRTKVEVEKRSTVKASAVEIFTPIKGLTIVFNPPYTIVKFNAGFVTVEGKAKCHPLDEFDKFTGFITACKNLNK